MTKPINTDSIEKATNISWPDWMVWFDEIGAKDMSHADIARLVQKKLGDQIDSADWWAQSITVAYEQASGRRAPGQRSDGSFEVSVSATVDGLREDVFSEIKNRLDQTDAFVDRTITNFKTSTTPVRSYCKLALDDGSRVNFSIEQKATNKVLVVVAHTKLSSSESAAEWREYWNEYLRGIL